MELFAAIFLLIVFIFNCLDVGFSDQLEAPPSPAPLTGEDPLAHISTCPECRAGGGQWCVLDTTFKMPFNSKSKKALAFGACRSKSVACKDAVQFGTMMGIFDSHSSFLNAGFYGKIVALDYGEQDKWCTTVDIPKELTTPSCAKCIESGFGWCQTSFSAYVLSGAGGACMRDAFSFACSDSIIPYEIGFGKLNVKSMLTTKITWVKDTTYCDKYNKVPARPVNPKPKCSDNLSCKECATSSSDCTFCTGDLRFSAMKATIGEDFFGACIDGADASCDAVKFGTLPQVINKLGKYDASWKIHPLDFTSDRCSNIPWPPAFQAPSCEACLNNPKEGWCEVVGKLDTSVLPSDSTTPESASKNLIISGGGCADEGLSFFCSFNMGKNVTMTWMKDSCPKPAA